MRMGARILYIEDNYQNFRLLMRMLSAENNGYEVYHAPDGRSGLAMAGELAPDLIFVDISLPDIDGVEVTHRLKESPESSHVPIVALTANAMVGDREKYLASGCDGYLPKPLTRASLREALAEFLPGVRNSS
jgi:two-component system cell cycle response regulator DivK